MSALDGALALAEAEDVAVLIGEDLELDVAGTLDELLHVEVAVAEGAGGFRGGLLEHAGEVFRRADDAHAAAAAACRCLEDDGIADTLCPVERVCLGGDDAVGAGEDGHPGLFHGLARGGLFAHEAGDFGGRTDEFDVGGAADLGEVGIFAEEAVAGMNGVDVGDLGCRDDSRDIEVAVRGPCRTDAHGAIRHTRPERVPIRFRMGQHRLDAQLMAGADEPHGDLTSIRNQLQERVRYATRCCGTSGNRDYSVRPAFHARSQRTDSLRRNAPPVRWPAIQISPPHPSDLRLHSNGLVRIASLEPRCGPLKLFAR